MIEYIFDLIISLFMMLSRCNREVTLTQFKRHANTQYKFRQHEIMQHESRQHESKQHEIMHNEPMQHETTIESTDFVPVSTIVMLDDPDFAY